jgi:hypothetical protein
VDTRSRKAKFIDEFSTLCASLPVELKRAIVQKSVDLDVYVWISLWHWPPARPTSDCNAEELTRRQVMDRVVFTLKGLEDDAAQQRFEEQQDRYYNIIYSSGSGSDHYQNAMMACKSVIEEKARTLSFLGGLLSRGDGVSLQVPPKKTPREWLIKRMMEGRKDMQEAINDMEEAMNDMDEAIAHHLSVAV